MNWLKKVNAIKTTDISDLVKKAGYNKKIGEIEKKYLIMIMVNILLHKLTADNFAARLAQAKLATINDIADFVKKVYFDEKLINIKRKVTLSKTRHVEVKHKLNDLSKKVTIKSTRELTKNLVNNDSIVNGANYFYSDELQNYLVFIST